MTADRGGTVERLLAATIAAIAELGYHRATTAEICRRADVTAGALFHHFESRLDLVVAALDDLVAQRLVRYQQFANELRADHTVADHGRRLLRFGRELTRDRGGIVWLEVNVAARTDSALRERLRPALAARWEAIRKLALETPAVAAMEADRREAWLQLLRSWFELDTIGEIVEGAHGDAEAFDTAILDIARRSVPPPS